MTTSAQNPAVDWFFTEATQWRPEYEQLRTIILNCGLVEDQKWGKPCYRRQGNNIVLIHGFKNYCAVLFFKGALLKDPKRVLVQQTENVQAARQMRFTSLREITALASTLKAYIEEAIAVEKAGLKVDYKKTSEFTVPEEFQKLLAKMPAVKKAFTALTPGRQRAYLLHFSAAKQSKTREARIEKYLPKILQGKGLDDE